MNDYIHPANKTDDAIVLLDDISPSIQDDPTVRFILENPEHEFSVSLMENVQTFIEPAMNQNDQITKLPHTQDYMVVQPSPVIQKYAVLQNTAILQQSVDPAIPQNSKKIPIEKHELPQKDVFSYMCDICFTRCRSQSELEVHINGHRTEMCYKCYLCPFTCFTRQHIRNHYWTHKNQMHNGIYTEHKECDICLTKCVSWSDYENHYAAHKSKKGFKCSLCPHVTLKKQNIKEHYLTHRNKTDIVDVIEPMVCDICIAKFESSYEYDDHYASHKTENRYQCLECQTVRNTKVDLKYHYFRDHKHVVSNNVIQEQQYPESQSVPVLQHSEIHQNSFKRHLTVQDTLTSKEDGNK